MELSVQRINDLVRVYDVLVRQYNEGYAFSTELLHAMHLVDGVQRVTVEKLGKRVMFPMDAIPVSGRHE